MKINKINKLIKTFLLLLLFGLFFAFSGCELNTDVNQDNTGNIEQKEEINQENVNETITAINDIGSVSIKGKDDIDYAKELYESLNDKEKALVTNYDVLQNAVRMLQYLQNESTYILEGYDECISYLENLIPSVIEDDVYSIEMPLFYEYKNEYSSYKFKLTWTSNNLKVLSTTGEVNHVKDDENAIVTCTIDCLKSEEKETFTKSIKIEKANKPALVSPIVICYFYGKYTGMTETDYETIDIVNYSFAQIAKKQENDKTIFYINVSGLASISTISELHQHGIRVCLSLGGWHDYESFWDTYSEAASTAENRKMVANAILETLEKYQLDGIDMDWEYPKSTDKNNFTLLMKQIYVTLKAKDSSYIISGAFPQGAGTSRFDYQSLNNYMDYFNIMTYDNDFNGSTYTTHVTDYSSTVAQYNLFKSAGCSASKIVLGMAFYGRASYVTSSSNNGLSQQYTSRSTLNYPVIKEQYLSRVGTDVIKCYDQTKKAYYLYDTTNKVFVSYDAPEILDMKYKYVVDNKLGGVMYWCYQNDLSGDLITAVNAAMKKYKIGESN